MCKMCLWNSGNSGRSRCKLANLACRLLLISLFTCSCCCLLNQSLFSTTERLCTRMGAVSVWRVVRLPDLKSFLVRFMRYVTFSLLCIKECVFTSSTNTSVFMALKFILHLWSLCFYKLSTGTKKNQTNSNTCKSLGSGTLHTLCANLFLFDFFFLF